MRPLDQELARMSHHSKESKNRKMPRRGRRCPVCRGIGIDPQLQHRYTGGGHDDRTCPECLGECYLDLDDTEDSCN